MIVLTGAAGFIGSCLLSSLNAEGRTDIVAVDDFTRLNKNKNLAGKSFHKLIDRDDFFEWMNENRWREIEGVFHLGARTDTAETDRALFNRLNLEYSKEMWTACSRYDIPIVYASSAATYGDGTHGYSDDHAVVTELNPLNEYGWSKQRFDRWALEQEDAPPQWYGLKFFNVYGPNEYHKGRMASVIYQAYSQIRETGRMKLFRSHHPDFEDGKQQRDFIYVQDVLDMLLWLWKHGSDNGLYNAGTGRARTFLDLTHSVFDALGKRPDISFIDTPEDIRENYQYFTRAEMDKLYHAGYEDSTTSLEDGIKEYVTDYLIPGKYY